MGIVGAGLHTQHATNTTNIDRRHAPPTAITRATVIFASVCTSSSDFPTNVPQWSAWCCTWAASWMDSAGCRQRARPIFSRGWYCGWSSPTVSPSSSKCQWLFVHVTAPAPARRCFELTGPSAVGARLHTHFSFTVRPPLHCIYLSFFVRAILSIRAPERKDRYQRRVR